MQRFFRVHDRRQRIVFHLDQIRRILSGRPVDRCDADHRLTDVTHLLIGQGEYFRRVGQRHPAALRAGELCNLVAGDRGVDAGMSEGAAYVDTPNLRARVRAANVGGVGDAGQRKIVDKMTSPGHERSVFAALKRLPDPFLP